MTIRTREELIEAMAKAAQQEMRKYSIQGTSEDGYGPPYKAPYLLLNVSMAEPEVNWPGKLIDEYDEPGQASTRMWALSLEAALDAAERAGWLREPEVEVDQ